MPKVSVVVPVYNVEKFLKACLDSVLRQTLTDIEVICVNDGSTDGSGDILAQYAERDSRVTVITQENGGYGKAMNAGVERARGEYVAIAEPDDRLELTMLEDLYQAGVRYELDIVKGDYYEVQTETEPEGRYLIRHRLDRNMEFYNRVINPQEEPRVSRINVHTWTGLYRLSFLRKNRIVYHETPGASFQDIGYFWHTLMYAERLMLLDHAYYQYCVDNPGSSNYDAAKMYAVAREYEFIEDIFHRQENIPRWEIWKTHYQYKKYLQYRHNLRRVAEDKKQEFVDFFSDVFCRIRDEGELDLNLFNEKDREDVLFLMEKPDLYLEQFRRPDLRPPKSPSVVKEELKKLKEKNRKNQKQISEYKDQLSETRKALLEKTKSEHRLAREVREVRESANYKTGAFVLYLPKELRKGVGKIRRRLR